jgi:cyclin B
MAIASQTETIIPSLSRDSFLFPSKRPPFTTTTNTSSYQYTGQVDNIDERDAGDPLCATEYVEDMYEYFRNEEVSTSVRSMYMEKLPHINERMRSILVDWLVEVHLKFKLVPQTLYLTVNLIDRYLERKEVPRSKLQLVGVTSLFIASKYEEIYPAPLREHVFICDHAYTSNEILGMEHEIPETLKYQVTVPTAHTFLVRFLKQGWSRRQEACSARMLHFGWHT